MPRLVGYTLDAMGLPSIFNEAERAFITEAYLYQLVAPREVVTMLNKHFGKSFKHSQVQRWISNNLSERRKVADSKLVVAVEKAQATVVKKKMKEHQKVFDRWVERSERGVDRAFTIVEG